MTNKHYSIEHYFLIKNMKCDRNYNDIDIVCRDESFNMDESYFIEHSKNGMSTYYFHFDVIEEVISMMNLS